MTTKPFSVHAGCLIGGEWDKHSLCEVPLEYLLTYEYHSGLTVNERLAISDEIAFRQDD